MLGQLALFRRQPNQLPIELPAATEDAAWPAVAPTAKVEAPAHGATATTTGVKQVAPTAV
jgi:hypothetical protein